MAKKTAETGATESVAPANAALEATVRALLARYPALQIGYYCPQTGDIRFSHPTSTHLEIKR